MDTRVGAPAGSGVEDMFLAHLDFVNAVMLPARVYELPGLLRQDRRILEGGLG